MDIFSICEFKTDPSTAKQDLNEFLAQGMPANVRVCDVRDESTDQSGLLHVISENVQPNQIELALELIDLIFEYGASWVLLNSKQQTPGCISFDRSIPELYERFVRQGVTSEVFLRRMTEEVEIEDEEETNGEYRRKKMRREPRPEENTKDYLENNVRYDEKTSNLLTSQNDGVMMDWETPIMKKSAELITEPGKNVLNVGFGMGIIDSFVQELNPGMHYIVEAHPVVLEKMKATGWYNKPNVVILAGPWKEVLPELLSKGITFHGIYFDTFSEDYGDMLEFFDFACGLLDFDGVFSFFNGLGADKQIIYDVYQKVVEVDLAEYGFQVEYEMLPVSIPEGTWDGIKRSYFNVKEYAMPKITFQSA